MSGAMWVTSYFFYKKSYLKYDRFVIAIASIFLSTKVFNEYQSIEHFCKGYHKVVEMSKGITPARKLEDKVSEPIYF